MTAPRPDPTADEALVYLHIPKTGGISTYELLLGNYPNEQVFHVRADPLMSPAVGGRHGDVAAFKALPEAERAQLRCVLGHFHFSHRLHRHLPGPSAYVTLLRDPVKRILSQLGQFNLLARRRLLGASQGPVDLAEFARLRPGAVDNHQVRFLCGGGYGKRPVEDSLALAIEHLDSCFRVVGTVERMTEFAVALAATYGWETAALGHRNAGGNRRVAAAPPDPALIEELAERNAADRALHAYANARLSADLTRLAERGPLPELVKPRRDLIAELQRKVANGSIQARRLLASLVD